MSGNKGNTWVADNDGFVRIVGTTTTGGNSGSVLINDIPLLSLSAYSTGSTFVYGLVPVRRGDRISGSFGATQIYYVPPLYNHDGFISTISKNAWRRIA